MKRAYLNLLFIIAISVAISVLLALALGSEHVDAADIITTAVAVSAFLKAYEEGNQCSS